MPRKGLEARPQRNDIADFLARGPRHLSLGRYRRRGRPDARCRRQRLVRPALQPKVNLSKNSPRKLRRLSGRSTPGEPASCAPFGLQPLERRRFIARRVNAWKSAQTAVSSPGRAIRSTAALPGLQSSPPRSIQGFAPLAMHCRPSRPSRAMNCRPSSLPGLRTDAGHVYSSTNSYIPCPALLSRPRLTSSSHTACGN